MKYSNQSIAQKLRWLNNKALKNEWTNEDITSYLSDLDIYYECDDEGDDFMILEVYGSNSNYFWNVYIESEWSEEEDNYWTKEIENTPGADLKYDAYKASKKIISIDVDKAKVNEQWF